MIGLLSTYASRRMLAAALAGGSALSLGIALPMMMHPAQAENYPAAEVYVNYASPLVESTMPRGTPPTGMVLMDANVVASSTRTSWLCWQST